MFTKYYPSNYLISTIIKTVDSPQNNINILDDFVTSYNMIKDSYYLKRFNKRLEQNLKTIQNKVKKIPPAFQPYLKLNEQLKHQIKSQFLVEKKETTNFEAFVCLDYIFDHKFDEYRCQFKVQRWLLNSKIGLGICDFELLKQTKFKPSPVECQDLSYIQYFPKNKFKLFNECIIDMVVSLVKKEISWTCEEINRSVSMKFNGFDRQYVPVIVMNLKGTQVEIQNEQ